MSYWNSKLNFVANLWKENIFDVFGFSECNNRENTYEICGSSEEKIQKWRKYFWNFQLWKGKIKKSIFGFFNK